MAPASAAASTSSSPSRSGERDRLAGEPQRRLGVAGEVQDLGEPGQQPRRAARPRRAAAVERLAQQLDQLGVDDARLVVAAAVADRGAGELLRRAPARERARPPRTPSARRAWPPRMRASPSASSSSARSAGSDGSRSRSASSARSSWQRLVLPGERLGRPVGRLARVADRRLGAGRGGAPGRSGGPARPVGAQLGAVRLERLGDAAVQPHAPRVAQARVQRLADQRVRERRAGRARRSSRAARRRAARRARRRPPRGASAAAEHAARNVWPATAASVSISCAGSPSRATRRSDDLAHALRDHQLVERPPGSPASASTRSISPRNSGLPPVSSRSRRGGAAGSSRQPRRLVLVEPCRARRRRATARGAGRRSRRPAARRRDLDVAVGADEQQPLAASRRARGAGGAGASARSAQCRSSQTSTSVPRRASRVSAATTASNSR